VARLPSLLERPLGVILTTSKNVGGAQMIQYHTGAVLLIRIGLTVYS
jgi:hypothetical protein